MGWRLWPIRILLVHHDGVRSVRRVKHVGEGFYADPFLPTTRVRLLPFGKVDNRKASYIHGWEPLSPKDWNPSSACTAHERIAELERDLAECQSELSEARRSHADELNAERSRFRIIAAAVREAEKQP